VEANDLRGLVGKFCLMLIQTSSGILFVVILYPSDKTNKVSLVVWKEVRRNKIADMNPFEVEVEGEVANHGTPNAPRKVLEKKLRMLMRYLAALINVDLATAKYIYLLGLVWFLGSFHVLDSVFIMEPDSGGLILLENTVKGSFGDATDVRVSFAKVCIFIGWLFGSTLLSGLSDLRGRKLAFLVAMFIMFSGCLLQILSFNSIYWFICGRIVLGIGLGGAGVVSYVWACEWMICSSLYSSSSTFQSHEVQQQLIYDSLPVPDPLVDSHDESEVILSPHSDTPKPDVLASDIGTENHSYNNAELQADDNTTAGSSAFQVGWAIGGVLCSPLALLVPQWRAFISVITIFALIPCLLILIYVPESPRWLLTNKKVHQFHSVIHKAYGYRPVPNDDDESMSEHPRNVEGAISQSFLIQFMSDRQLVVLVLGLGFIWFANAFVYYGMLLNSNHFPGQVYLISCLMNLLAIPGQLLAIPLDRRFGLRKSFLGSMASCALVFALMSAITALSSGQLLDVSISILSVVGTFICSLQFSLCYMVSFKCYATSIRNTGVGIGVTLGRIGAMVCPLVVTFALKPDGQVGYSAFLLFSCAIGLSSIIGAFIINIK
jgi:MFS family permease